MELLDLVARYQELLERKENLKLLEKENNENIDKIVEELALAMVENDCPKISYNGYNYSLSEKTIYSKKSEKALTAAGLDYLKTLKDFGLGGVISEQVNQKALQSSINKLVKTTGTLPLGLKDVLSIYETYTVTRRKKSK